MSKISEVSIGDTVTRNICGTTGIVVAFSPHGLTILVDFGSGFPGHNGSIMGNGFCYHRRTCWLVGNGSFTINSEIIKEIP